MPGGKWQNQNHAWYTGEIAYVVLSHLSAKKLRSCKKCVSVIWQEKWPNLSARMISGKWQNQNHVWYTDEIADGVFEPFSRKKLHSGKKGVSFLKLFGKKNGHI